MNALRWLQRLFGRERLERELDQELAYHMERRVDDLVAEGTDPQEAARRVRLEFGGPGQIKEVCRDARGTQWVEDFFRDCSHGLRLLRRSPVFTSVAILSLALGIGATTAIFSLMDRLMLRTLPVREPERLAQISPCCLTYPLLEELQQGLSSFEGLFAHDRARDLDIDIGGQTEPVDFHLVSGSYFEVLGVDAVVGRTFTHDVDRAPGANPVAVISHRYWERRFASDSGVIGKTFRRVNTVFTIIGVTPREFFGTMVGEEPDITVPVTMDAQVLGTESQLKEAGTYWLTAMGRLKPGIGIDQARTELRTVLGAAKSISRSLSAKTLPDRRTLQPGGSGFDDLKRRFAEPLAILMATVALLLLLACANLANLLLARSAVRQREIAVRLAIGAGRERVVRQLLAEGLLLALFGCALGVLLAYGFAEGLVTMMSNGGPRMLLDVTPDHRALFFALAVSVIACLLFSLAPALLATRQNLKPALAEIRAARWRLGKGLVVAQMSISVLLLIGAGLFGRTLINIYTLDPGFDRSGVVLFSTNVTGFGYTADRIQEIQARVVAELNALPGIQSASLSELIPISSAGWHGDFVIEGTAEKRDDVLHSLNWIGPDYFKTFGTPVLMGREFNERDTAASPRVVVVNEAFARYYFKDRSPVGRWLATTDGPYSNVRSEIVGVVKDVKYGDLRQDSPRTVYFAVAQSSALDSHFFAVRTDSEWTTVTPAVRGALARVDPALRPVRLLSLEDHVAQSLLQERMLAILAGFFGGVGLLLGAIGIYGVMAFQVARRRREIGIRMALGADAASITGMVLGQTARLTLLGCAIGAAGGLLLTSVAEGILFGISPNDPLTFTAAIAALLLVALAAAYLPGRSAARTNPVETLRAD